MALTLEVTFNSEVLPARVTRTTRVIRPGLPDEVTTEPVTPIDACQGVVPLPEIDTSVAGVKYEFTFEISWD